MITDKDVSIAKMMAGRYRGGGRFDHDDGYQAALEGLIKANYPVDEPLRIRVMRDEMRRQSVEASYLMRVPYSSWKRMDQTPERVKDTGLNSHDLNNWEDAWRISDVSRVEEGYGKAEDVLLAEALLATLDEKELAFTRRWMNGYHHTGRQVRQWKEIKAKLRKEVSDA